MSEGVPLRDDKVFAVEALLRYCYSLDVSRGTTEISSLMVFIVNEYSVTDKYTGLTSGVLGAWMTLRMLGPKYMLSLRQTTTSFER
jgi:hypothetical protein